MFTYFDTTDQHGTTLDAYESKAEAQNKIILDVFKSNPYQKFTPYQVHDLIGGDNTCLISNVKRAITTLTKSNHLRKLDEKIIERYGRENFVWVYNSKAKQSNLFNQ